jgi:hypothetical protein
MFHHRIVGHQSRCDHVHGMRSGGTKKNALSQKRLGLEQWCLGSFCSPRNDNQNDDIALPEMRVFQKNNSGENSMLKTVKQNHKIAFQKQIMLIQTTVAVVRISRRLVLDKSRLIYKSKSLPTF